jgi:signal transduction histidine kinase
MNEGLRELYENIRASFDHLDGYLTLFTPLHRRLYRTSVEIQGRDISKYLRDLFGERLERHGIKIQVTQSFHNWKLIGYPSTFYPVFVNLIDNAIFWLKDRSGERRIKLDEDNGALLISDTGPGILPLDREVIFELGFTRKPGGRGLGLYISRDVLKKAEYSLSLDEHQSEHGATFRIEPIQ